ncbi:MAG: PASTA domain-containing protein [Odoribacteraceae bacterium]|jgi:beta-lactam-binding protein with PASTA domain|nr:PASTA domain-containing protein [Odoribacteraceae bacterium]
MRHANKKRITFWTTNIALALILLLAIILFVLHRLDSYTRHGHYILVPNLRGVAPAEATRIAETKNLHVTIIDSVFDRDFAGGAVVEQYPLPDAKVKNNRVIQLTVNAKEPETVRFPAINQPSYRQALQRLRGLRLRPGRIEYAPSPYANLVLGFRRAGAPVEAGALLPVGARVDILLGDGGQPPEITVPRLAGKTRDEAIELLLQAYLNTGEIIGDRTVTTDTDKNIALVYDQRPAPGQTARAGNTVTLYISRDPRKTIEAAATDTNQE